VQDELRRHLADFAGPCLLVTHDAVEALVLGDRLLVVEDGRVVQEGTPAAVAARPATDYVARLVGLNLFAGRVDGSTVVLDHGGRLVVPDHGSHGQVLVAIRPSAITVATHPSDGTSARNGWTGTVVGLTMLADRVRLDVVGPPRALVDVTPAAVAELDLRSGAEVWLSVKATDLEVYERSVSPSP
jgi:molybdate transport system ATP-binding protein